MSTATASRMSSSAPTRIRPARRAAAARASSRAPREPRCGRSPAAGSSQFGYSVAGAGDVDHDGHADVIVSAPDDFSGGAYAGRVVIYSGASGAVWLTLLGATGEELGSSVASVGRPRRGRHARFRGRERALHAAGCRRRRPGRDPLGSERRAAALDRRDHALRRPGRLRRGCRRREPRRRPGFRGQQLLRRRGNRVRLQRSDGRAAAQLHRRPAQRQVRGDDLGRPRRRRRWSARPRDRIRRLQRREPRRLRARVQRRQRPGALRGARAAPPTSRCRRSC